MIDPRVVRLIVLILGAIDLVLVAGVIGLLAFARSIPDAYWGLTGLGVGAFTGLLASLRSGPVEPESTGKHRVPAAPAAPAVEEVAR